MRIIAPHHLRRLAELSDLVEKHDTDLRRHWRSNEEKAKAAALAKAKAEQAYSRLWMEVAR